MVRILSSILNTKRCFDSLYFFSKCDQIRSYIFNRAQYIFQFNLMDIYIIAGAKLTSRSHPGEFSKISHLLWWVKQSPSEVMRQSVLSVNIYMHSVNIYMHYRSVNIYMHSVNIYMHSVNIYMHYRFVNFSEQEPEKKSCKVNESSQLSLKRVPLRYQLVLKELNHIVNNRGI